MRKLVVVMKSGATLDWMVERASVTTHPVMLTERLTWVGVEGAAQVLYLDMTAVAGVMISGEREHDRSDQEGSGRATPAVPRVNEPG
jgi:hypothetical protein